MPAIIEQTVEYAAFNDALRYFLCAVNIQASDLAQHFPHIASGIQADLFEDEASS